MQEIKLCVLEQWISDSLMQCGMDEKNRAMVVDTVMRATLRGVGHHDIYDFPGRINGLLNGEMVANPEFQMLTKYQGMESWDGGNGLGELVCSFAMERAMELADQYGLGLCAIRNSNHFMAAAPYVERASELGYIALLLCKGAPAMGAPGRRDKVIGTLPMGFAFPTNRGYPVMLDACMAYASYGALKEKMDSGQSVPTYWGFDSDGNPTSDPAAMAKGTRLPIGGHKGFGLAILGEVLTALLSQGCIIDEVDTINGQGSPTSHTAIVIKADALMPMEQFKERTGEMVERMQKRAPGLHIPGQGSYAARCNMQEEGAIMLTDSLIAQLNALSERLHIATLHQDR